MRLVICCKHRRNEATLGAQQLAYFFASLGWHVRVVSPTPLSRRKHADVEHWQQPLGAKYGEHLSFEYLSQPPDGELFVWLGELDVRWVYLIAMNFEPQVWYPDCDSLRMQASLAGLMSQVLFTYGYALSDARRFLQGISCAPRVLGWPLPPVTWNWGNNGGLQPILDLSCQQLVQTPQVVLTNLQRWQQQQDGRVATVLYDKKHGDVAKLLKRDFRALRAVFVPDNDIRRTEYIRHNLWLSFNMRPHLGALLREAQVCGTLPVLPPHLQTMCSMCYTWQHPQHSRAKKASQWEQGYAIELLEILSTRENEFLQISAAFRQRVSGITPVAVVDYWQGWALMCQGAKHNAER